ncbi:DUF262 domain-containing protein [Nocardioides endophyticus]|uniref:DUF262 domain-containing protein n=1 Tax=Nocardioides endophyticus TaxID=1353775 RepID=A0ABP8YQP6_9ACTN
MGVQSAVLRNRIRGVIAVTDGGSWRAEMGFLTRQRELGELMALTASGAIQLPDFQRDYLWSDERVRQLLVTVAQGHPLGAVLLLDTGTLHLRLRAVPLEGTDPARGTRPELLLLDGQHRLTALTQALTGSGVVGTEDAGSRRYLLHVPTALARPDDLYDAVRSVPASEPDLELEHGCFPLGSIFSDDATRWLTAYGAEHEEEVRSFLSGVVSPMRSYGVPTIELDERTTMAAVATVFERINQSSVSLTVFELLTARFAGDRSYAEWTGAQFRLRDDWDAIRGQLDDHPVLDRFGGDDFVQAVALVATHTGPMATTARKEDVLDLSLAEYLLWAPRVRDALLWAATFLDEQHLHVAGDLPYPRQVVPLAAIRAVLGDAADVYATRARVRQWFWCGVLGELYDGAIEARFARDLDEVPGWAMGDTSTTPDTVAAASFRESRLHPRRTHSAAYKGSFALLMGLDAMEWVFDESFDKAHYLQLKIAAHEADPALLGMGEGDEFFVARRAALRALVEEAMGKPVAPVEEA